MKKIFVITGTPGTGKTRLAGLLRRRLRGAVVISANDVVEDEGLFSSTIAGSKIVKMRMLEKALNSTVRKSEKAIILIEGHILCDLKIKNAKVIVLREHLKKLKKRMETRGYDLEKIKANIVAEATDYCGLHAEKNYRKVFELLESDRNTPKYAIEIIMSKRTKTEGIDLLHELIDIIKCDSRFAI